MTRREGRRRKKSISVFFVVSSKFFLFSFLWGGRRISSLVKGLRERERERFGHKNRKVLFLFLFHVTQGRREETKSRKTSQKKAKKKNLWHQAWICNFFKNIFWETFLGNFLFRRKSYVSIFLLFFSGKMGTLLVFFLHTPLGHDENEGDEEERSKVVTG